jgi:hypothetical protein
MAPLLGSPKSCSTDGTKTGSAPKIPQRPFGATGESVGIDKIEELEENFQIAQDFTPPTVKEIPW